MSLPFQLLSELSFSKDVPITSVLSRWKVGNYLQQVWGALDAPPSDFFTRQMALLWATHSLKVTESFLWWAFRLYQAFPRQTYLEPRLSWQHYRLLIPRPALPERQFYVSHCRKYNWTARELARQLRANYYQRQCLASPLGIKAHYVFDMIPAAVLSYSELELEQLLCNQLRLLMLEFGPDFSFVGRQKMLRLPGGRQYFVDLVFYHVTQHFHLLIELKVKPLSHRDIGQLDTYVRLFDQQYRPATDAATVGLLLCPEVSPDLLHYSALADHNRLLVATYTC